jgi:hypothetical protein
VPGAESDSLFSPLDVSLGLFPGRDFRLTTGRCTDCAAIPQALWYFADETIAAPRPGVPVAGFARGMTPSQDLRQWAAAHAPGMPIEDPPLVWMGSPAVLRNARLAADGSHIDAGGKRWSFSTVAKVALNRSYYDASSVAYLSDRTLSVRGKPVDATFIARTIWPEDFRLDEAAPSQTVTASPEGLRGLVRAEPRGGAHSPFAAVALWERRPGGARQWQGAPVLGIMLNGAQGDDDEAHGGHFAMVTGRVGPGGAMGDWVVNNFYTLDQASEKAIIAGVTPLDNYLADLNSGQAWYRPSYLIVAVLRNERAASQIQGALSRVYNQFYRHQLVYRHTSMNCTSISTDVLRALGWSVPARGAASRTAAWLGLPYFLLRERSLARAAQQFEYLSEDLTRLLPAVAFEEMGTDLVRMATGTLRRTPNALEAALADDLEAICFLRVPQLPSSRVWGDYPVVSPWEYLARLPSDPERRQIIPVPDRPFPERLRDADLLPPPRPLSDFAIAAWATVSIVGIPWLLWRWWRRGSRPLA